MNTLTASAALRTINERKATAKLCVTPSTMVAAPKIPTTTNNVRPTCRFSGPQRERGGHDRSADAGRST